MDGSRNSEHVRRRRGAAALTTAVLAAFTLIGAGAALSPAIGAGAALSPTAGAGAALRPTPDARYDGEFGLWVDARPDSVVVHWITRVPQPGTLEVLVADRVIASATTNAGYAHRAAFRPPRQQELLLRYGGGAADAVLHETLISLASPRRAPVVQSAADSVYIIGDTHGMLDELIDGLQRAGLIDSATRWSGGRKHLVLAGDLTDRGADVLPLLWLVYRLEREAAQAGGRVHVVLGNHEIMVMLGDLRYVHPKEAEIAALHGTSYDRMFDTRTSILGRWLAAKPAALRIGETVIVHGGLHPTYARGGLRMLDDSLRSYMAEELFHVWSDTTVAIAIDSLTYERRVDFFWGAESPFWHRGYVQSDTLGAELDEALRRAGGSLLVVGHTPVDSIHTRYDGRLIAAHTPRFGAELVLLVRESAGLRRYRITPEGTQPFEE